MPGGALFLLTNFEAETDLSNCHGLDGAPGVGIPAVVGSSRWLETRGVTWTERDRPAQRGGLHHNLTVGFLEVISRHA